MRADQFLQDDKNSIIAPNGREVRKGTFYAMIMNCKLWNDIKNDPAKDKERLETIHDLEEELVPSLEAVTLFHFFEPIKWLDLDEMNEGKILVASILLKLFPQYKNEQVINRLKDIKMKDISIALKEYIEKII